jgi:hypothetical protein
MVPTRAVTLDVGLLPSFEGRSEAEVIARMRLADRERLLVRKPTTT